MYNSPCHYLYSDLHSISFVLFILYAFASHCSYCGLHNLTYSNLPPYLHHLLSWWFCKSIHQVLLENLEWFISLYILYIGWMFHLFTKSLKSNNKVKKNNFKKAFTVGIKSLSKWGSGTAWGPLAWSSFPSTYCAAISMLERKCLDIWMNSGRHIY